ncbi:MAG: alpha-amylase family glycosyl hydrolase, partial [Ignavibacteriaceae bacterium]
MKIYEINFRVWIKQFAENAKLSQIPLDYFQVLAKKGIDIIWLMGIWKTCPSVIKQHCFEPPLVLAYNNALPSWREEDVIGSPFAIDKYEVNPDYGNLEDLKDLKENLNKIGLKLFLDFIPNHFSADTTLIKSNPNIFLQADEEVYKRDNHTYFRSDQDTN